MRERRDHLEDPLLLGVREPRLEADQVVRGAVAVLGPQLHDRVRALPGARIAQADRPHRPERAASSGAALGHHLDRQAALEVARLLEVVRRDLAARATAATNASYSRLVERAVDVVADAGVAALRVGSLVAIPARRRGTRASQSIDSAATIGAIAS